MRGCIVKSQSGDYALAPARGVKVRLNNPDEVIKHVGQHVKVSGAFIDADDDTPMTAESSASGPNSSGSSKHREFRVVKIEVISTTCAAAAGKRK